MIKFFTVIAVLVAMVGFAGATRANPYDSDQGVYQVELGMLLSEAPTRKIFDVPFTLRTLSGEPVLGAMIEVHGGMSAHGHGLPTAPVVEELGEGQYVIHGMKLSMPGTWQLYLMVSSGDLMDRIAIEFDH